MVGAAYASGLSSSETAAEPLKIKVSSLLDWTLSSSGILRGDSIADWIDAITGNVPMESFPIRSAAVATDLQSQRAVVLDSGRAGRAVQASDQEVA